MNRLDRTEWALLGLLVDGIDVDDAGCVAKSWPGFWNDLVALGATRSDRKKA